MVSVSSLTLSSIMRSSVAASQSSLATAESEISSGTYADLGVQLGGTSGHLLSLTEQQNRLAAYTSANTTATTRLNSTAGALTSLQSAASSFLTSLTTASSNGGMTATLQASAKDNLKTLLSTLNTTVAGQAIFGGINSGQTPMTAYTSSPASANKQAVDSAFQAAFGTSQTSAAAASITGSQMTSFLNGSFANLFSASSYSSTWSSASSQVQTTEISQSHTVNTSVSANDPVFRGLAQAYTMVSELTGSNMSADAQQAVVNSAVNVLTTAMSGLTNMQASVGISQNAILSANDHITAQTNVLSSEAQGMAQVDPYQLSTKISSLQTQIEASYELTSSLHKLSLVNYLS